MSDETNGCAELTHTFNDRFLGQEASFTFRFARPGKPQVDRAQKLMMKKKVDAAMRALCLDVIHEEDRQAFTEALETYPGLAGTFGEALLDSCGFGQLGN